MPAALLPRRRIGATAAEVCVLGLGGAPLGNHQHVVDEANAQATIEAAYAAGIRYFDVAPQYGHGLAEHRFGRVLREVKAGDFLLSTKVGRVLYPRRSGRWDTPQFKNALAFDYRYDYSYDGIMRSVEDSLQRLGLAKIDVLYIHNIDSENLGGDNERYFREAVASGHKALARLKADNTILAVGVGNNHWRICKRFAEEAAFDVFMVASASAYSLLVTDLLDEFLPFCAERNIAVVIGGALNSGILARGAVEGAQFAYRAPDPEIVNKVQSIQRVCAAHGVPLLAAALQFPLGHRAVASVVQGARSPEQIAENVDAFRMKIPDSLWSDLKAESLLREDAPIP